MKTKVIHFEKAKKKIRDNRRVRYNARDAYVHFLYQKKYKINSELSDLYMKYLGELKTWIEFKEALPKLEPELLYYSVVHYFFAWHRCMRQLFDTSMFQKLGFYYQFRYSKEKYRRDTSRLVYWCNPFEPINKGKLGSTQNWRINKLERSYY